MSGIFANIFDRKEPERRDMNAVIMEARRSNAESAAGSVTPGSSMRMAAVYACVRILAETVASLPLLIYERQARGKRRANDFYLYELLHDRPNPLMTAFEYRETVMGHLALWGNGYSRIVYGEDGRVESLWPMNPANFMDSKMLQGRRYYLYLNPDGKFTWYSEDEIWHLRGLGGDGETGYSPIGLMRRAVGLGLDAEEFGARFFINDARPGIVLEHPGALKEEAHKRLKESWEETYGGVRKSHKPAILEEGMKIHEIGIPPQDAQFLETRKFQVQEIARIFRIPPHMLADLDRATFSNIEHQSIDFVVHSIRPWLVRWEQSINQNLMLMAERERFYAEHLVDGLLRGDVTSRYQAYATARTNGWMSANDIRELENMNPVEGGDVYLVPLNMIPADQVGGGGDGETGREGEGEEEGQGDGETGRRGEPMSTSDGETRRNGEERMVVERRGRQAAAFRHRLAGRQVRLFRDVATRILRRERNDVGGQARKMLKEGSESTVSDFEKWLRRFYEEHAGWSAQQMLPAVMAYAEMIADAVGDELGENDLAGKVDPFVRSYADGAGRREAVRSEEWLLEMLQNMKEASAEEVLTAVEGRLNDWVDTRPESIASEEAVTENNAVAVALYGLVGIRKLMSVATGESSCPYCRNLDGKVIGINEYFLSAGQSFQPTGAEVPLVLSHSKRHSPFHGGCDCITVSGG